MGNHDFFDGTEVRRRPWGLTRRLARAVLSRVDHEELLIGAGIALGFALSLFV